MMFILSSKLVNEVTDGFMVYACFSNLNNELWLVLYFKLTNEVHTFFFINTKFINTISLKSLF